MEKLIKKDMIDPVTGDKLSDRDIIPLQRVCVYMLHTERASGLSDVAVGRVCTDVNRDLFSQGGTGFAGSGVDLRAKEARPVMQV